MNKVPLSEIADITPGFAFKSSQFGPTGHKVVKIKDITPPFVETANSDCVVMDAEESQKLKKFRISRGDFVVAMTGATIGKVGIYVDEGVAYINQRVAKIDAKGDNDKSFIYYCLCSESFIKFIFSNLDSSSAQGNISADGIGRYTVSDVAFSTQRKIASILSALDDKIELNHKINAELEHTARLIYDYWFTQFDFPDAQGKPYKSSGGAMVYNDQLKRKIPESWDADNFSKYFRILSGFPFKSNTYDARGSYKVVTIKNVKDDEVDTSNADRTMNIPDNLPNYCKLSVGDLLISLTGNVGRIAPVSEDNLLLNQRVGKLQPVSKISKEYASLLLKRPEQAKRIQLYANGSSQANLSPIQAVDFIAVIPNDDILDRFQKIVEPLFNSIITNRQESAKLAELRDWLLPMLMNGQVKVV